MPATPRKKERLSQSEASLRMLSATTQLLLQYPPAEVTVLRISETAGVHHDYVARYFGSREELMAQAVDAAILMFTLNVNPGVITYWTDFLKDVDLLAMAKVRHRTITYLIGCGVDPERFRPGQEMIIKNQIDASTNGNISERTKANMILIGILLFQGMNTFSEVNGMTEQQVKDVFSYIAHLGQTTESVQQALGWDKPATKKRK